MYEDSLYFNFRALTQPVLSNLDPSHFLSILLSTKTLSLTLTQTLKQTSLSTSGTETNDILFSPWSLTALYSSSLVHLSHSLWVSSTSQLAFKSRCRCVSFRVVFTFFSEVSCLFIDSHLQSDPSAAAKTLQHVSTRLGPSTLETFLMLWTSSLNRLL